MEPYLPPTVEQFAATLRAAARNHAIAKSQRRVRLYTVLLSLAVTWGSVLAVLILSGCSSAPAPTVAHAPAPATSTVVAPVQKFIIDLAAHGYPLTADEVSEVTADHDPVCGVFSKPTALMPAAPAYAKQVAYANALIDSGLCGAEQVYVPTAWTPSAGS